MKLSELAEARQPMDVSSRKVALQLQQDLIAHNFDVHYDEPGALFEVSRNERAERLVFFDIDSLENMADLLIRGQGPDKLFFAIMASFTNGKLGFDVETSRVDYRTAKNGHFQSTVAIEADTLLSAVTRLYYHSIMVASRQSLATKHSQK